MALVQEWSQAMFHYAADYQRRHDLLHFCTEAQQLLFKLLVSGKRGFILEGSVYKMEEHHIRLTLMLWIYCYAAVRLESQPREIFYISKTRAEANSARNLFHGIGHLCIQDPQDVPAPDKCLKQEKKATEKTLVGDCTVRFMWEDSSSVFAECLPSPHSRSEVIILCDLCVPGWAITLSKKPGRYVYGVTLKGSGGDTKEETPEER